MPSGSSHEAAELVARLRSGDTAALAPLYERYSAEIYRVGVVFLGNEADAEDLVHDVFAGLERALRMYAERGTFGRWLRQVAVRTALMQLRARKRERDVIRGREWGLRRRQAPPPVEDRLDLATALATLPEHLRIVFVLKETQGYRHKEIAKVLGISVTASKVRLFRARARLRACLDPA